MHSKNIWHRVSSIFRPYVRADRRYQDLKGDNILVDAQGICKISDFGISKQTGKIVNKSVEVGLTVLDL